MITIPPQANPPMLTTQDTADGVDAGLVDRVRLWNKDWYLFFSQIADKLNSGSTPTPPTPPATGTVVSVDVKLTSSTLLTVPSVVKGDLLVIRVEQDGTGGRVVTFPANCRNAPVIPTVASTASLMCFIGTAAGIWDLCGTPILGRATGTDSISTVSPSIVRVIDQTFTAPATITSAILTPGSVLIVRALQDATGGHAVSFGANFAYTPAVPTTANTSSLMIFFGAQTNHWELCAMPILGRAATAGAEPLSTATNPAVLEVSVTGDLTVTAPTPALVPLLVVRLEQDSVGNWTVDLDSGFSSVPSWTAGANQTREMMFFYASSGIWELCAGLV